jgi:hypothetical protein
MYIDFHPSLRLSARVHCSATFFLTVFRDESSKNNTNTESFVYIVFSIVTHKINRHDFRGTVIISVVRETGDVLTAVFGSIPPYSPQGM